MARTNKTRYDCYYIRKPVTENSKVIHETRYGENAVKVRRDILRDNLGTVRILSIRKH